MLWTISILSWVAWSMVNAFVAETKHRSSGGVFVLSLLLSPFLGSIYILGAPALPERRAGVGVTAENLQALSMAPSRPDLTPEQREAAARSDRRRNIIVLAIVLGLIILVAAVLILWGRSPSG